MENLSITNLEQSKLLVMAGLDVSTADFSVLVNMKKENGVIIIEETPYIILSPTIKTLLKIRTLRQLGLWGN